MSSAVADLTTQSTIPLPHVPMWAWGVVGLAAAAMYTVTLENGAMLGDVAGRLHEFLHDGRHFSAVPCH